MVSQFKSSWFHLVQTSVKVNLFNGLLVSFKKTPLDITSFYLTFHTRKRALRRTWPCWYSGHGFPAPQLGQFQLFKPPVAVQLPSHTPLFAAPCTAARQAPLSFTTSWGLLKLVPFESVMPPNHLILCCSLLLPSIIPSIGFFCPSESLLSSGGQSIGASALVLPMNIQDWFPLGTT